MASYPWGSSPLTRGKLVQRERKVCPPGIIPAHAGKTITNTHDRKRSRDHPRSRGENASAASAKLPTEGSSPLTRGKRQVRGLPGALDGIIPAHAGKTGNGPPRTVFRWDHPRSRGENILSHATKTLVSGSSPLTRGKLKAVRKQLTLRRIIPAHAGKTSSPVTRTSAVAGSSPLTRGKRSMTWGGDTASGIIPAHAGKTLPAGRPPHGRGDHPRSRGENHARKVAKPGDKGSSPLTRGKRILGEWDSLSNGIIPAHAGKTSAILGACHVTRDHPRSRGENPARTGLRNRPGGSSPLTRGKPCAGHVSVHVGGIIPAHAGKTVAVAACITLPWDHPRSRGENIAPTNRLGKPAGSSPLTRGKLGSAVKDGVGKGIIPAHAGKT